MKRLLTIVAMTLVLVGGSVVGSEAGKKRIRPTDLKPYLSNAVYNKDSNHVRSADTTEVVFWAEVKLPAGKTIKKLSYYHSGHVGAGAPTPGTAVWLWKTNFAGQLHFDPIMEVGSSATCDLGDTVFVQTNSSLDSPKIKSGNTYFVNVYSENWNSFIHGIEITYN